MSRKPLRIWPGVLIIAVVLVLRYLVPLIVPDAAGAGVLAAVGGTALLVVWWLFFSRAAWVERLGAIAVTIAAVVVAKWFLVHPSIAGGMMGLMLPIFLVPMTVPVAFVLWAVATRHQPDGVRRVTMVIAIVLACGVWTLARTDGIKGGMEAQLTWRWTPTAEERLLARADDTPAVPQPAAVQGGAASLPANEATSVPAQQAAAVPAKDEPIAAPVTPDPVVAPVVRRAVAWTGFRGAHRDGVVRGIRLATEWSRTPPVELWRRPIGPGWSSFAVHGDRVYTQEQRGEFELVSCYDLSTGAPVWRHRDEVRFYESNAGPGPRGTPEVHGERVFTLGATGLLNALDAATGRRLWSRNAAADTGAPVPDWGFAGSPAVVGETVIVATSGRLAAYDLASGTLRWTRATGGGGYSSPHVATIGGIEQVLLARGGGITSVAPGDGSVLWEHAWPGDVAIVQPAMVGESDVLLTTVDAMGGQGMRRIAVTHAPGGWTTEERWTSRGLKPYYNDFVVHDGHAYGFDGSILSCIELESGERRWKGGRYGQGQLLLLAEDNVLLVLSEEGELALVSATPDKYTEVARYKAIEGKTWNHPVVVGDMVLVRNGEEMAAFRLPLARQ